MIPAEQLRALIRLLWPAEITPTAKRQLEALCDQAEMQANGGETPVEVFDKRTGDC